jgi:hypothetical protein
VTVGSNFRKRRLYKADEGEDREPLQSFTIPKDLKHKPFRGMGDFSIPEEDTGTIWTPGPNFPSIDMIISPDSLFQITISRRHPVKQEPLRQILEKLPVEEGIVLYTVVPDEIFDSFPFQQYHNDLGKVSRMVPESVQKLEQWVLGVPLGKLSTSGNTTVIGKSRVVNKKVTLRPQTLKKRRRLDRGERE